MIKLNIKPLSVNQAWQGRRFKTKEYKQFEKDMLLMLPKKRFNPPFKVAFVFGFSNSLCDIDNPLKLTIDVLQKKYGINDRDILELSVKKEIVKKGNEFIKFSIETAHENIP
jgi:Holliday junction resolvase RusA-like endonuclease